MSKMKHESRKAIVQTIRELSTLLLWEDNWDLASSPERHMWAIAYGLIKQSGYDVHGQPIEPDEIEVPEVASVDSK